MRRVHVHKRGSVTAPLQIATDALLSDQIQAKEGALIAARVLTRSERYGCLEDIHGRPVELYKGDVIVGALGQRQALHGHGGQVPEALEVGDTIHLLNLGGVMGLCHTSNPQVGPPIELEVLGAVMAFPVVGSRQGTPATLQMAPLAEAPSLSLEQCADMPPLVVISGTCMNAGKTLAACAIVRSLHDAGHTIRVGKLTGVAARKDVMAMVDCGALGALTFVDVGLPSTTAHSAPLAALKVLHALYKQAPQADVLVLELGDGLMGTYGVMEILTHPVFAALQAVHVCCASDPVGAAGAAQIFKDKLGKPPTMITGPVTDNLVGCQIIEETLNLTAINALQHPKALGDAILGHLNLTTESQA